MKRPAILIALVVASAVVAGQGQRTYPSARTGGNYMHAYYLPPAPSSTPWAPSWSPDGKAIAVAMSGSIWKIDPANGVCISGAGHASSDCGSSIDPLNARKREKSRRP